MRKEFREGSVPIYRLPCYTAEAITHVVAIKGSLKNGFLLFFLRLVSPVPCNTLGIVLYT